MEAGLQPGRGRRVGSLLVVAVALACAARALPLARAYFEKLRGLHTPAALIAAACAAAALFAVLWILVAKRPRAAAGAAAIAGAAMVVLSGNVGACGWAGLVLALALLAGDAACRLILGAEIGESDLTTALATGLACAGTAILVLGESGVPLRPALAAAAAGLLVLRRRRVPVLARRLRGALRVPRGDAPRWLEAGWLALTGVVLVAAWAAVQGPDVSWDALAYHLPEARDIAVTGRVRPLAELAPQSLLWKLHDATLALGFLTGGERVVRFLQLGAGLAVFGAASTLAKRLGAGRSVPLIFLASAGFPTAMLQLRSAYVDWPAALLVTAAAVQLAGRPRDPGRWRLAGFLLGAAVATKVFALFAAPALLILAWRARPSPRRLAAAAAWGLLALAPWIVWSARRAGSVFAPYASSATELAARLGGGHYFTTSPATGVSRPERSAPPAASLLRLPYDLVYHSSRFEANGDGYNGILVLVLLTGLLGWRPRVVLLFLLAAVPFLIPWSRLYLPSIRFLFPVYPLYAVFTAEGLRRLTGRFSGPAGAAAGYALLGAAALFPVQLGSGGFEWKVALGAMTREESLAARLPAYPLRGRVRPSDRVLLIGENDRFHSPAASVWRAEFLPVAGWGDDPEAWRRGLRQLGITRVVWRADRSPGAFPIRGLGGTLVEEARNGPAVLYRISGAPP